MASGRDTTVVNKTLGTTTQVNVKLYGNGDIEFTEVTAAKPVRSIYGDDPKITDLIKALATVA